MLHHGRKERAIKNRIESNGSINTVSHIDGEKAFQILEGVHGQMQLYRKRWGYHRMV